MSQRPTKPTTVKIGDKEYTLVVMRVIDFDAKGRPNSVIVGYDDATFDLRDDSVPREFYTAWVPTVMLTEKPEKRTH